jgi:hypothetical protein
MSHTTADYGILLVNAVVALIILCNLLDGAK